MNPVIRTTIKPVKKIIILCLALACIKIYSSDKDEAGNLLHPYFIPPSTWEQVDPKLLSPTVIIGYVDKSKTGFLPSINLAKENVNVSLSNYLLEVKKLYQKNKNNRWRDLGYIVTKAGKARLTEIDTKNKWGEVRILQLIFMKNSTVYVLTSSALKKDFHQFYPIIQKSLLSFDLSDNLLSFVEPGKTLKLEEEIEQLKQKVRALCNQESETDLLLKDFKTFLEAQYFELGYYWQKQILDLIKNEKIEGVKSKDA